jgi:hypothetical protein
MAKLSCIKDLLSVSDSEEQCALNVSSVECRI